MLKHLFIQNYAIIDELEIAFSPGLNVITGETGAGKSIIIGALNLILGERADTAVLVNKGKKCVIEGVFLNDKADVKEFLIQNELDDTDDVVVRREIATSGKTRAFINDTPVTLQQLQVFRSLLVDLHRQFDTLSLTQADFQRNVLDALAGNEKSVIAYKKIFSEWQRVGRLLSELKQRQRGFEKETDYLQFQFDELTAANFKENELESADADLKLLSNSEGIKNALSRASHELQESETPIVQQLKLIANQLHQFAAFHAALPELISRLSSAQVELLDIASELENINSHVVYDVEKIEQLNERLSLGYKLQKKYGVQTTAELLSIQTEIGEKLQAVSNIGGEIDHAQKEYDHLFEQATLQAALISESRQKQTKPFEKRVNELLKQVGMPNASIKVEIATCHLNVFGSDEINFLFDANKSGQFKPVSKVASGGELSRLMLCIKSLVAKKMDMPTLIFDEIDSGISGEAAKQVGLIMKELSSQRQVICITHQPQIAGKADEHLFVYKVSENNKVTTNIKILDKSERITTIAQMLGGEKPTAAALANAREMVTS